MNTFLNENANDTETISNLELARATDGEKESQLKRRNDFVKKYQDQSPAALEQLKKTALAGENIFGEMMNTVKYCTLGQITQALYEVGGKYRRNM